MLKKAALSLLWVFQVQQGLSRDRDVSEGNGIPSGTAPFWCHLGQPSFLPG